MIIAPIPSRESARLDALYRSHILDTPSEPAFDDVARLAAYVCRTPIAVISLVDSTRQWFKSVVGLSHTESPRSQAFCAHTILGTDLFIVEEADVDERFADHPWVVESPSIRFYAGVPLITPDGHAIGSLAVMDVVPRTLTPEQHTGMHTLAKQVMAQLTLRTGRRALPLSSIDSADPAACAGDAIDRGRATEGERSKQDMLLALMLSTGPGCIKRIAADGTLLYMNPAGLKLIEAGREQDAVGRSVFDLVLPEHREAFMRMHHDVIGGAARTLQFKAQGLQGTRRWLETHAVPFQDPVTGGMEHLAITYDISERKQAEEALRLSQERLHQALRASNTGLWDWNTESAEVSLSKEWKSQLGYGESELPDRFETWISRLHPEDCDQAVLYAQRYRDNPVGAFRQDFRLRHKDGSYRWIDSHASFVTEPDGRRIRLLGSHTDITERKQAEHALRKSEERFNYAIEATNDGVWDWDIAIGTVYFSPQWIRLLGYLPDEVPPSTDFFFSILHPEDVDRTTTVLQDHLDGRTPLKEVELRLRQKSGEYRWFLDRGKVVARSLDGRPLRMVGTIADITERRNTEEERARALNNLQTIMETVPDVIFALDLEGCLSKWNLRMEVVTGYTPIELSGKSALEMVPFEETERTAAAIREAFATGYAELEGHLLTKDGRTIPYHWTGAPFTDLRGRVIGITGVGRDMTERKKAERMLAAEKQILEMIGADAPLSDVLDALCRMIESLSDGALCSVLLLDDEGRHLNHGAAPSLPEAYIRSINGMTIGLMRGSCGTAAFTGRQVIVEDIASDPLWTDFSRVALAHGLRSCWSTPINSAVGKVLGTFAVYYRTVRYPVGELSIVDRASHLACLAIERARAQAALRLTRFSIERAVDAVFWIDSQAHILDINDAACKVLGYTREELLSKTVQDIDPNFPAESWPAHWEELKARKSFSFETFHRRKDGAVIQTETTVNFLFHEGQEYNCAFMRDITARKQAEAALRMTRFSFERVSDAVFWIDSDARILDVNEAACLSLQYSREDLLAMRLFEVDPHITLENWARLWKDKVDHRSMTFESLQIRKDGTIFPVEATCNYLQFGGQEFCCAILRNISERKDTEGRLKFSEERFRLVAEAANDILWDWDLITGAHWWSPNACEKFGYDPNTEPDIQAWTARIHPDDRDRVLALVERALASAATSLSEEYRFRLSDGSYGYFYDRGQIIRDASGRPIRMIGAMIDVTFSKRAYASLETAYQRLQSMSRELQTVESNERRRLSRELHDEVGQLLTGLKFDLEATRQALSDKSAVAVTRAHERTLRALETTDELFARLRRIVRALRPPVLEELGLKEALEAMISDIQSRSELVCLVSIEGDDIEAQLDPTIEAALYRMTQELATNVVRHARAMTMAVTLTVDSQYWMLTVEDDGIGFDPKVEAISGMGMRGIRERTEILGGRVDFSSVPGSGSTVTVWIPVTVTGVPGSAPEKA